MRLRAGNSGATPSGTRRPRARTGGLRGSPTRPATARGACRRPRTPWAPTCDSSRCRRRRCRAASFATPSASSSPPCTGPRKPIASSTRSAFISNSVPGTSRMTIWPVLVLLPLDARGDRASRPCRRALRSAWSPPPSRAFAAFFVRARAAQLDRPVRPHERLVLLLGRLRQQLELGDRRGAMAVRRADAVRAGVAAADDDDVLAGRRGSGRARGRPRRPCSAAAGTPSRNGRRRARGPAPAGRAAARRRRRARRRRTPRPAPVGVDVHADVLVHPELDAFGLHLLDAAVDQVLLHLEIGDAVAQQPADAIVLLEHDDGVAGARELLRAGEPGRAGADDRDALAGLALGRPRRDPAASPSALSTIACSIDLMPTGSSLMLSVHASSHGAGQMRPVNSGKLLVECSVSIALLPVLLVDEVVPVRNDVVDRAAAHAERRAAVHAARALDPGLLVGQARDELAPVLHALLRRLVRLRRAARTPETGDLAHDLRTLRVRERAPPDCGGRVALAAADYAAIRSARGELGQRAAVFFREHLDEARAELAQSSRISRARALPV